MELWTFYNVFLPGAVPVLLVWFGLWAVGRYASLLEIVGDGQLCFFSIALLAVNSNDIDNLDDVRRRTEWAKSHLHWAAPSSYIMIIIAVFIFGLIISERDATDPAVKMRLTMASVIMTCVSLGVIYYWRANLDLFA